MKWAVLSGVMFAVALGLAPAAAAKDLTKAEVCGASGCAALQRDGRGDGLRQLRGPTAGLAQPPKPGGYYTLKFVFGRRGQGGPSQTLTTLYVPSANLVAANGPAPGSVEWFEVSAPVLHKVRTAAGDLEPFAAPKGWPRSIDDPVFTAASKPKPVPGADEATNWTPWRFAAGGVLLALGFGAFLARRMRLRRPTTA